MADAYGEPLNPKQERSYSLVACIAVALFWFVQVLCKVPEVFGTRPLSPEWDRYAIGV